MAGRKVFTSGEILTAADVNSFLMNQVVAVFADSTARSSAIPSPSEGMVTYREDANRVEVYDGASFGPIGGILQVVSTTKTDTFSASVTTGASAAITGLSASITPSSTNSKILLMTNLNVSGSFLPGVQAGFLMKRDATTIANGGGAGSRATAHSGFNGNTGTSGGVITQLSGSFLDSPSSTSAISYSIEIVNVDTGTNTMFVNRSRSDNDDSSRMRGASTITLMEVAV